jgi:hypothetical protein
MWHTVFERRAKPVLACLVSLGVLAGCNIKTEADLAAARVPGDVRECDAPSQTACFFRNSPVKLVPEPVRIEGRRLAFFPIATELAFVDGRNRQWVAPARTLTDGASIPLIFVPIVGEPTDPAFVNAAAVHDAYCGIGNEAGPVYRSAPWQEVHRVFYDTLIVGGTPKPKAQLMYAAVYLGGPRWYPQSRREDVGLDLLPVPLRRAALVDTRTFIETTSPSFRQLMRYLEWKEWEIRKIVAGKDTPQPLPPPVIEESNEDGDLAPPITGGGGSAGAVQGP